MDSLKGCKRVLITGGTGSLGLALVAQLERSASKIRIFSRDEKKQYDMKKQFPSCEYLLGDIRDPSAVRDSIHDVDVVIHGASLKYVNISEIQPAEYTSTNVIGTMNLMDAVLRSSTVERVVGISSDKACLPVNAYGLTKAILEKLVLEGNRRQGAIPDIQFNIARYGNVLGTRGSVVPFWAEQREQHLPLPITDPNMTRFFFPLSEAVELINYALNSPAGLILSKRMSACTLEDLADVMKGPEGVDYVGPRPGEKQHEQLLSADEMSRTYLVGDIFEFDPNRSPIGGAGAYGSDVAPRLNTEEITELVAEWL